MSSILVVSIYIDTNSARSFTFLHTLSSFPCGSAGKESACNAGDLALIPGLGRFPGEGKSYPVQYSGLENSMDSIAHGITKSRTRLSYFHFHFDQWEPIELAFESLDRSPSPFGYFNAGFSRLCIFPDCTWNQQSLQGASFSFGER